MTHEQLIKFGFELCGDKEENMGMFRGWSAIKSFIHPTFEIELTLSKSYKGFKASMYFMREKGLIVRIITCLQKEVPIYTVNLQGGVMHHLSYYLDENILNSIFNNWKQQYIINDN